MKVEETIKELEWDKERGEESSSETEEKFRKAEKQDEENGLEEKAKEIAAVTCPNEKTEKNCVRRSCAIGTLKKKSTK